MCHNCHLIIVDTTENINQANDMLKEVKNLSSLKFVAANETVVKKLDQIKKSATTFIADMKRVNGTQGTSDAVLKMNADFNKTLMDLKFLQKNMNYSSIATDYLEKLIDTESWIKKIIATTDLTIFYKVIDSLDAFDEDSIKEAVARFNDAETFKKEFRKMKIDYTRELAKYSLWECQRNSFISQIMKTRTIEEFNTLVRVVEARSTMNYRLAKEMRNVVEGIKQVGLVSKVSDGVITHEDHSNVSKITFKLKKEENDDTVTFEIDDLGNTRYILGDYHASDYRGENALEREESDLEKIQQDLLKFGFAQSEPTFQSKFGFHSNKSFREKEMEMK